MIKIIHSFALILFSFFLFTIVGSCKEITSNDYLITSGTAIKTVGGENIVLKGVNIGGWLLQTIYMSPVSAGGIEVDATYINKKLVSRFGEASTNSLFDTYYSNYITASDLNVIASTNANVVRVSFWWRNFMDENGNLTNNYNKLDWLVSECSKRGLYVILDMHGAPGSQNGNNSSGLILESPMLFSQNDEGRNNRTLLIKLWESIANHFRGNATIAGFDILNEPYGGMITNNHQILWDFYNWSYNVIRKIDSKRIVILEPTGNIEELIKYGKEKSWNNVLYSPHDYMLNNVNPSTEAFKIYYKNIIASHRNHMNQYNVPIYVGEMSCYDDYDAWQYVIKEYLNNNISFTAWAYKSTMNNSKWGIIYRSLPSGPANINNYTFSQIKTIWSYKSTNMTFNINGYNALKEGFKIQANKITLDKTELSVKKIEKIQLNATISPTNTTNKKIIWVSSNSSIASVDANGLVTVKASGIVYIVAKAEDNLTIKASCKLVVNLSEGTLDIIPVSKIELDKNELSIKTKEETQLKATISPTNATNKKIIWVSSNSSIASVDANGLVTVKASGIVYIVAKAEDNLTIKASCKLVVDLPKEEISIDTHIIEIKALDDTIRLYEGETYKLKYEVVPEEQKNNVAFKSTDESVVNVDTNGLITAKKVGIANIRIALNSDDKVYAISKVIVQSKTDDDIDSIYLNKDHLELYAETEYNLSFNIKPTYAKSENVIWSSSDEKVLTVDASGKITALSPGKAIVKIMLQSDFGKFSMCEIMVVEKEVKTDLKEFKITSYIENLELEVQEEKNIMESIILENIEESDLIYESSDINILSVDDLGLITTKESGYATIKVSSKTDPTIYAEIDVKILSHDNLINIKKSQSYFYIFLLLGSIFLILILISLKSSHKH